MADIKSKQKKQAEMAEEARNLLGNVTVDTSKLLLIYARQSTNAQFKGNVYSTALQTRDLIQKATALGWTEPYDEGSGTLTGRYILFVENEIAEEMGRKRMTSGRLPIDERLGLKAVTDYIDKKQASAVMVVDVSRLFRDETGIQPATFAEKCKQAHVQVLTDDYTYEFTISKRGDNRKFREEADEAAAFIPKHIIGKMLKARKAKAQEGKIGNGIAPIGLMRDETGDYLTPSPHAEKVNEVYQMFYDYEAKLNSVLRKLIADAQRGIPLFPIHPSIDSKTIYLTKVYKDGKPDGELVGWTITSRFGLQTILRNPAYIGHVVWNGEIVKQNAHKGIVDPFLWEYAFSHLAKYDLDGNEIHRDKATVRYQQKQSHPHNALLAGTRHDGRPVIDGVGGSHVYIQLPGDVYVIKDRHGRSVNGFLTSISTRELDGIIEKHLLDNLQWAEQVTAELREAHVGDTHTTISDSLLVKAVRDVEAEAQGDKPVSEYDVVCSELERVTHILDTQERFLTDERRNKYLLKEQQLTKRRSELEYQMANKERTEAERRQAQEDIKTAQQRYAHWPIDRKRRFIHLVTDEITLEEIADGWLRLSITWSSLVGKPVIHDSPIQIDDINQLPALIAQYGTEALSDRTEYVPWTEHCYIWRTNGSEWTTEELAILKAQYPTASKDTLLELLPKRSWNAIMRKAIVSRSQVRRSPRANSQSSVAKDVSLSDLVVIEKYALQPKSKVQWVIVTDEVSNAGNHKRHHH